MVATHNQEPSGLLQGQTEATSGLDIHQNSSRNTTASRVFRRRTPQQRQPSVASLDRLFETGQESETSDPRRHSILDDSETLNTYGVAELRDSFFDAVFYPPEEVDLDDLMWHAKLTLPYAFRKQDPLSLTNFFPKQWHEVKSVVRRITQTRAGIKLLKSFLGFFIAYVLCLVPPVRSWLGPHSYVMVISALLNHPGRALGAQVEGTILTIIGTAAGLGWGAFGLWLSTVTATARLGFGGILAMFLCLFIFVIASLRSYYIRTYQMIICAGIAVSYTCLADVSNDAVSWSKLLDYGVPWVLGQVIAMIPCVVVAPDAGARPLAVSLHNAFSIMVDGSSRSRTDQLTRRRLAQAFVNLSQTYRDLVLDFSITLFDPKDVLELRNLMQGVIRALLSLKSNTRLFDTFAGAGNGAESDDTRLQGGDFVVDVDKQTPAGTSSHEVELLKFVAENLVEPTEHLFAGMRTTLQSCDAVLMDMCGHRQYLGPPANISDDVARFLVKLRRRIITFVTVQDSVLASKKLPPTYAEHPEVVKLFAFCRPVHQAATAIEALAVKVNHMQQQKPERPRFHPPTYPFWKSLHRTNAQVRHDRGGLTAGSYFRSFNEIAEVIERIASKEYEPLSRREDVSTNKLEKMHSTMTATEIEDESPTKKARIGKSVWKVMHRAQGFETRFGLKTTAVTSLLSVPAWLAHTNEWWNSYEAWWAVVMAWLIMAPRVGGNVQDLFTRALCAVLGALWGGLSYVAGNGNPFVTAVFALIFMIPMIYRFTQSTHPRSGLVGCIAFTVVSLTEYSYQGNQSPAVIAATRGGAIAVGVSASIIVNWIIWPFVARHDLRKAISMMLFYCSIIYRSIVSKYVYYEEGHEPTKADIEASEIMEGRLREGFVRLRQLLGLTRHEIRLRSPYDPLPYSALIDACEQFFEYVVALRQSSLFYHPQFVRDNTEAAARLLGYRRDAIATIMTNLYVLSGALRADRKKYLPNAAAARKELLDQSKALEAELMISGKFSTSEKTEVEKWAQIYSYSYNESLTGCVEQLKELEKYTKVIVGEQGFDAGLKDDNWVIP
ncbi:putative ER transporter 6TM N-terminal domain-containing protein [Seiridium cardinale]